MNRRMILLTLTLTVPVITTVATTVAQTPSHNTLTAAEEKDGWKLLFDG